MEQLAEELNEQTFQNKIINEYITTNMRDLVEQKVIHSFNFKFKI